MSAEKKKTKEDTWRSDELTKHIQGPDGETRRRDEQKRTKRDEMSRKQRSGESTDRRLREPERDERREREKPRERDPEEERRRREERERRKERERDGERRGSERRGQGDEREKERQRERYKDRDREREGEPGREKERDRHRDRERDKEKERYREIDRDRERSERHKDRERDKDRDKEKERYKDRERDERHRDREKDEERERRRGEKERRRAMEEGKDREKDKEREREKREHRTEYSGRTDREERKERRRREKDEAGERHHGDLREADRERRHRDGENGRLRDGEERDKRKERRREESVKGGGDHRHDKSTSELRNSEQEISTRRPELSWRSNQADLSDPEIPMENEDNEDNNKGDGDYENEEYEEDFERADYEEDFEEMGEEDEEKGGEEEEKGQGDRRRDLSPRRREEIEAIQRAIQRENELVSSAHSRPSTSKTEPTQKVVADSESQLKKGRTQGRLIDFTAARQREVSRQTADKQKKRSAELLRLIDLDYSVTMCLLDLPPVSEYDMYIKSFGMANTKQAYVQCNEDNTDRDTQTEDTDTVDKWTQHPPESNTACGGPKTSQDASDDSVVRMNVDSKRLTTFLRSAAQVMAVLLEENRAETNSVKKLQSQTDSLSFSEGRLHLNTKLPFLQGRQVTLLHFSQVQTHTLLSVHAQSSGSSDEQLDGKTLICVWNIWEPSAPQRILTYEAEVRCCCFSPGKATLVFAGTAVGSVVLWDLREHSGSHSSLRVGGEEWALRYPTFSTDSVMLGAGHFSSVVSVEPVVVDVESGTRGSFLEDQEESLGLLFQLGSLDEDGLLNLWVVTELSKADDSGSQTDLGLRPGGKVKLLHSSSIQTSDRSAHHGATGATLPHLSLLLKFLPSDSNHYFIGTNMGVVRRGTRHGLRAVPKLYRPEDGERPAHVTALDFCPSGEPFFLVGCSDGTVRLHSVLQEEPVLEWSTGSVDVPVLSVLWSRTRSPVFCVLDAASVLHIWDLTEKDMCPIITESFRTDRVSAMAVFGEAARQSRYSGVALAKQSGGLEIHFLKPSLTVPQPSDTEKLHLLAQDNL